MKHAPVQSISAAIVILGAQAVVRAETVDVADPGSAAAREVAPAAESIDPDAVMSVTPGDGVGVFVQYASGGHWNVFTACDTNRSNQPCRFDIIISADPGVSFSGPEGHQLEPVDVLSLESDGSIRLQTGTAGKLDGVTFDAEPGATIRVDVLLDGVPRPEFVNWIGDDQQRQGTSGNPVDFTPSAR